HSGAGGTLSGTGGRTTLGAAGTTSGTGGTVSAGASGLPAGGSVGSGGSAPTSGGVPAGGAAGSRADGGTAGRGTGGLTTVGGNGGGSGGSRGNSGSGGSAGGGASGGADGLDPNGSVYVAATGDDSNPGTLSSPVRTLAKARDIVRTLNGAMKADLTVYVRGGTYPLTDTLTFSNADSGAGGFHVKYMAYPGERPLITGGQPIKGWELFDSNKNIYAATGVTTPFRQLYVNGTKAIRARSPNLGANGEPNFTRCTGWDAGARNFQVASSDVSSWKNLEKVEMHLMVLWADNTMRIASITTSGSTAYIKVQSPEDMIFERPNPAFWPSQMRFYFENAFELLDQPGEWYLDETAGTLYYMPRSGEDMTTATVIAPMLETLVAVKGTSTSDQASYLWFEGLTFAHSTYMRPSQYGFLDAQAGQYNITAPSNNQQTVGRPGAGVTVTNAHHIHFERNLFTQMAATGLDFISGTHDDLIIGNAFTDIGGSGISIGKFVVDEKTEYHVVYDPTDKNDICTRDTIKNNYVHHATTEIQGATGIAAGYPAYLDLEHNEVSHVNYTGISVGYGWNTATNAMTNNKIAFNDIHHVCEILADCGSIYTLSNQMPASEILNNYCHDFQQSQWADYSINNIYLDEGTDGYTVAHNVLLDSPNIVHQNKNGSHVTIEDNGPDPTGAQSTITNAGIESAYSDIKTLSIPAATF
ncbi:MAG: right-handed parallel beta-helix repeat-containing protein, partial [Polyangiaceae bacterium]|nr:right-handed parallel beta-helix repeat-containing protein [Polyangiaceae bacterium]